MILSPTEASWLTVITSVGATQLDVNKRTPPIYLILFSKLKHHPLFLTPQHILTPLSHVMLLCVSGLSASLLAG